jgi:anti-repressor protein
MQQIVYLSKSQNPITDSEKVAWKFQKRHDNVLRAIDELVQNMKSEKPQTFENQHELKIEAMFHAKEVPFAIGNGATKTKRVYYMTEQGFTLLVMGFTGKRAIQFKLDYIAAFDKMRKEVQQLRREKHLEEYPQDFGQALRMLADQWDMNKKLKEERLQLTKVVEQVQPKVEYYEMLVDVNGYTNFTDTAKLIGIPLRQFISELVGRNWLYRDNKGDLKPYADKVKEGYLTLKEWARKLTDKENEGQKKEVTGTQTRVTQKGREELLRIFKKHSQKQLVA